MGGGRLDEGVWAWGQHPAPGFTGPPSSTETGALCQSPTQGAGFSAPEARTACGVDRLLLSLSASLLFNMSGSIWVYSVEHVDGYSGRGDPRLQTAVETKPCLYPQRVSTVRVWNSLEFYLFGSPIWQTGIVSPDPLTQSGFSQLSGLPRTGAQLENVHALGTKAQDPGLPIWGSWSYKKEGKTFPFSTSNTRRPNWAPGKWKATGFFWDVKALT